MAMIRFMLVRDLKQFSAIYMVFLYAFAQCFYSLSGHSLKVDVEIATSNASNEHLMKSTTMMTLNKIETANATAETTKSLLNSSVWEFSQICLELFKMTLGVYDLELFRHSILARLFFLLFMYLVPILFNM